MKKKALRKDFWMEIRKGPARFISTFLIVGLGVAFFSGIRATRPDMELSADRLYDGQNFMDIEILGTLGLNEGDLAALKGTEGVKEAEGAYSKDVLYHSDEKQYAVKIMSLPDRINRISVKEGRVPRNAGECIADLAFLEDTGLKPGDTVEIEPGDGEALSDSLAVTSFTIVGSCSSPQYLSMTRGTTTIGSGSLDSFLMVLPEAFSLDYYTEIYMTTEGTKELLCYDDAYTERVEAVTGRIEDEIVPKREQSRYEEIRSEAQKKLDDAAKELADGREKAEKELADAWQEIQDGEEKLEDGKKDLKANEKKLEDAEAQIQDGEETLTEAEKELEEKEKDLKAASLELENGRKEYESGRKTYEEKKKEYDKGTAALKKAAQQLSDTQKQLSEAKDSLQKAGQAIDAQEEAGLISAEEAGQMRAALEQKEKELAEGEKDLKQGQKEYEQKEKLLSGAQKELAGAEKELKAAKEDLDAGEKEYESGRSQLTAAKKQIEARKTELADAREETAEGRKELADGKSELKEAEQELADGKADYEKAKADTQKELDEAEEKLKDSRKELDKIKPAEWYVLDRSSIQTYVEYSQDAERIGAIGEVFPLIFFLVAALVCLTAMTRMVEEQRTEIGTLKALGYNRFPIAMKYIGYAFLATVGGSITGGLIGCKILPYIIITAYKIMYRNLDVVLIPFNWKYIFYASLLAVACVLAATGAACFKELLTAPAELMRPEAPKQGKRVLLERIGFLWKHLNFTRKATIRNLFRYKKRFFMTIFGIAGCMALLLVGFGVKDSIFSIVSLQFNEVEVYDASLDVEDSGGEAPEALEKALGENEEVDGFQYLRRSSVDAVYQDKRMDVYQKVFESGADLDPYICFRDRRSRKKYQLSDEGVFITEKLAKKLGVKAGDRITLEDADHRQAAVPVEAVVENYVYNYVYMTSALYERVYGEPAVYNQIMLREKLSGGRSEEDLAGDLLSLDGVTGITLSDTMESWFSDIIGSLDIVVFVLIVSAGGLAFVVLFNLNHISMNERRRELATLKVLGFYDLEVSEYMYRENIILTFLGMAAGAVLGILLHRYVILTCEIDMIMFGRSIFPISYVYSALLTCLFSLVINISMHFKLKKIDMASSLKSVE